MSKDPIDNPVGDDVLIGSSVARIWSEEWEPPEESTEPPDDVKIDVSVIAGQEPRTVEMCFDWHNIRFNPPNEIYDEEGTAYSSPAIPLQLTPEAAIELGKLLIEAGERSKK